MMKPTKPPRQWALNSPAISAPFAISLCHFPLLIKISNRISHFGKLPGSECYIYIYTCDNVSLDASEDRSRNAGTSPRYKWRPA
jgi:hypothetical protein